MAITRFIPKYSECILKITQNGKSSIINISVHSASKCLSLLLHNVHRNTQAQNHSHNIKKRRKFSLAYYLTSPSWDPPTLCCTHIHTYT